jgi:signal transduction histidine kinase
MGRRVVARAWTEAIAEALSSCSNLSDMIAQIGDTTKLEARHMTLQLTVVDICHLLDEARDHTLTHARSKSISLEIDAKGPLQVAVDPRLLLRVFESLITCSIRQTPTGGRILLETRQEGGEACIAVHRSGPPIPVDQREAIFEKFQPGESAGRRLAGWGLGLYFCRLTAEAHQAKLTVESSDAWSSSYMIRLALIPTSAGAAVRDTSDLGTPCPAALPSPAASALLSVRRTPSSPKTRAALARFVRTFTPLETELNRTT